MEELKTPIPEPSCVLVFAIVGLPVMFQQIPRAVTADPPSALILPPLTALFVVIDEARFVVSVDKEGSNVVKEISCPYEVPASFVA
jgi:hypothetical protein